LPPSFRTHPRLPQRAQYCPAQCGN
jgi:hypothetical protein